jgi:hypothetical protein
VARILGDREVQALEDLARQIEERGLPAEGARLRLILELTEHRQEVGAALAAAILHASPQTVGGWVRRGMLAGRVDEEGHVFVGVDALWRVIELDTAMPYADPTAPDITDDEILAEIAAHRVGQKDG